MIVTKLVEPETAVVLGLHLSLWERLLRIPLWLGLRLLGWLKNYRITQRLSEWLFLQLSRRIWDWRVPDDARLADQRVDGRSRGPVLTHALAAYWRIARGGTGPRAE